MATVTGLTAARMLQIENASVVGGSVAGEDLILTTRGGTPINAGKVKGSPGAPGGTPEAYGDWLKENLPPKKRAIGFLNTCVIVGSSNAVASTWAPSFCAKMGLTQRNFAIAGSAFTGNNNFYTQLQNAAANEMFANTAVGVVIIADASNNIRSWNDAGSTFSITTEARQAFAYARTTFPNARIICLPSIWPADPVSQAVGVPGGYQKVWHRALMVLTEQMTIAAMENDVEIVDQSHTWLTGMTGVMEASNGVHPNAAGYELIAQWMVRHVMGNSTRRDVTWANAVYSGSNVSVPGLFPIRVRREGWTVFMHGSVRTPVALSNPSDLVVLPVGFRPVLDWEISARENGKSESLGCQVYSNGQIRLWNSSAAGTDYIISGTWTLS